MVSRRNRARIVLAPLLVALAAGGAARSQAPNWLNPARVLVIYSTTFPDNDGNGIGDSTEVAQIYQAARGVPTANLLGVPLSVTGDTFGSWTAFYNELRVPLVARLSALGSANIDVLLFCHGVPYYVPAGGFGSRSVDQLLRAPTYLTSPSSIPLTTGWFNSPYFEASPAIGTNVGHFSHAYTFGGHVFHLAARIDGPDVDAVRDLVAGARYGDLYISPLPGYYRGPIYTDTRYSNYAGVSSLPYPQFHGPSYVNADQDMAYVVQWMFASGFPVKWENTAADLEIGQAGATFHDATSALAGPDALFYYGWYNYATYHDVWTWLPGSAACDLDSNSLAGVRSPTPGSFGGMALRRGATCAVGVIDEPYLSGHPFPEVFIKYLLDGFTFAESANVSDPTHAWRSLYVGDPLYCPMRSGKVPALDITPPAVLPATVAAGGAATAAVRVRLAAPAGQPPDLVTAGGTFGVAPRIDQVIAHARPYALSKSLTLSGLTPGAFHRAALAVRDPAGLATPVPELLFINDAQNTLAVRVQADTAAPAAGQPFSLEFAVRVPGGIAALTGLGFALDVPSAAVTGVDLLPLLFLFPVTLHGDLVAGTIASLEVPVAGGLPSGTYVFRLLAADATGAVQDALTIVVP